MITIIHFRYSACMHSLCHSLGMCCKSLYLILVMNTSNLTPSCPDDLTTEVATPTYPPFVWLVPSLNCHLRFCHLPHPFGIQELLSYFSKFNPQPQASNPILSTMYCIPPLGLTSDLTLKTPSSTQWAGILPGENKVAITTLFSYPVPCCQS